MTKTIVYEDSAKFLELVTNTLHAKICEIGIGGNDDLMSIAILENTAERRYSYKGIQLLKTDANENGYFIISDKK